MLVIHSFIHSFIPAISIAPLRVLYYCRHIYGWCHYTCYCNYECGGLWSLYNIPVIVIMGVVIIPVIVIMNVVDCGYYNYYCNYSCNWNCDCNSVVIISFNCNCNFVVVVSCSCNSNFSCNHSYHCNLGLIVIVILIVTIIFIAAVMEENLYFSTQKENTNEMLYVNAYTMMLTSQFR